MGIHNEGLEQHPTSELIGRLLGEIKRHVASELILARHELGSKIRGIIFAMVLGIAAGMFAVLGLVAGLVTAIAVLRLVVPFWAAALIVTVLVLLLSAAFALGAKSIVDRLRPLVPRQTLQMLKEDLEWFKTRLPSSSK